MPEEAQEKIDKSALLRAPTGMHDILPEEQGYWSKVLSVIEKEMGLFGFSRIDTPILERRAVFDKGTGAITDIIEKEMYTLTTRGGDVLALRPENTPGVIRAYLEHGMASMPRPVRLWYFGPMFRHDRPQKGRYRQFYQLGIECINSASPACDVEIILVTGRIFKKLGLRGFVFRVSSIGDTVCRPVYEKQLKAHLRANKAKLCAECRKRIDKRPLRVFDCKEEKCQRVARVAPKMLDNLCKDCHRHFKEVLEMLDELEITYQLDPSVVRGLDYYTRTVFEVVITGEESSGLAIGGGGRYDGLVEVLGGRPTPAVGVALGVERIIEVMKEQKGPVPEPTPKPRIFLAQLGFLAKKKALGMMVDFLGNGIIAATAFDRDSLKAQLKIADRLKVPFTVIMGQKEVLEETVIIRDMGDGTQEIVPRRKCIDVIKKKLKDSK